MATRPRPLGGKWMVQTVNAARWVASERAAERVMGDRLGNGAMCGVIYDPSGVPVTGGLFDGFGWVAVDPLMIEELMSVGESNGG